MVILSRWINVDEWDYFQCCSLDFFSYFNFIRYFFPFKYDTNVRRSASSFGHSDPDKNSVIAQCCKIFFYKFTEMSCYILFSRIVTCNPRQGLLKLLITKF